VAAALCGLGLSIKIAYENCLEMIRAFERGESNTTPQCQADESAVYFLTALPAAIIGIFALVLAIKDAPILRKIFGTELKE
jgi:hypothetical protein